MSLEVGLKKIRLILLEDFLVLLLVLGDPGLRWMFSEPDLLQRVLPFHLRLGIWNFSPLIGVNTSFALSLFCVDFRCVHLFQIPQCLQTKMSPFQILPACNAYPRNISGKTFGPTLMQSRQVFSRNRVIFYHRFKWMNWALFGSPNTLLIKVSSHQTRDLECFADSSKHSMESAHHFSYRPDCNNTTDVRTQMSFSLILRTAALSAIPLVSDLCGVDVQWCPGKIFTGFAQIPGICQCKWLYGFLSAPRTFVSSFVFSEKFLFYMGMIVSAVLPSLVPLQRIDDCFEIHILH